MGDMKVCKLFKNESGIDLAFHISLVLKGLNAVFEIISGVAVLLISQETVLKIVTFLTQEELTEDPRDRIVNYLLNAAQHVSIGAREFASIYLLSHGVIKLLLIINLLKRRLWVYPASLVIFALFIVYQIYRYAHTHSFSLILLTILDAVVMWLIYKEYRTLKKSS